MAGEETQQQVPQDAAPAEEPTVETPTDDIVDVPGTHPLEPGGRRFNQVYAKQKQAEAENRELRDRLARVEGQVQATQRPAQPQAAWYTEQQLQAAVDQGKITPALMASQLAYQQAVAVQLRTESAKKMESTLSEARETVGQYMARIPNLNRDGSKELADVRAEAESIVRRFGGNLDDPRVQEQACRTVFGSLDRMAQRDRVREQDRRSRVPHAESGSYSGREPEPEPRNTDPLSGIPKEQIAYWERLKYPRAKMIEEARYYRNRGPRR